MNAQCFGGLSFLNFRQKSTVLNAKIKIFSKIFKKIQKFPENFRKFPEKFANFRNLHFVSSIFPIFWGSARVAENAQLQKSVLPRFRRFCLKNPKIRKIFFCIFLYGPPGGGRGHVLSGLRLSADDIIKINEMPRILYFCRKKFGKNFCKMSSSVTFVNFH